MPRYGIDRFGFHFDFLHLKSNLCRSNHSIDFPFNSFIRRAYWLLSKAFTFRFTQRPIRIVTIIDEMCLSLEMPNVHLSIVIYNWIANRFHVVDFQKCRFFSLYAAHRAPPPLPHHMCLWYGFSFYTVNWHNSKVTFIIVNAANNQSNHSLNWIKF